MKKFIFAALSMFAVMASAHAIEVSEATVGKFVGAKFPHSYAGVQVSAPQVLLRDGHTVFCALARPKLFPKDVNFCANVTPEWRKSTGSLLATKMTLESVEAPGLPAKYVDLAKKAVNDMVLPALDGIEVYQMDNFIGRSVSAVKVKPGKLDIVF